MKDSFQEMLFHIPLHQLTFLIPLPKEPLYYETINGSFSKEWLTTPTLVIIRQKEELTMLNEPDMANQIIQDPNLIGIITCFEELPSINEDILNQLYQCGIPFIHVDDLQSLKIFQKDIPSYSYGNVSLELNGFMEKGFINIASRLAYALETPLLYLDENNRLLWHTGQEKELREASRWINAHQRELEQGESIIVFPGQNKKTDQLSFDIYTINVAGLLQQKLIASSHLAHWQKKLIDKLTGLTALLLQTEEMFHEQQQQFREHFIYDLLYHKFESQQVMVKQARAWGWNLAKPHHLFVIDAELPGAADGNWLDGICAFLENKWAEENKPYIVFPFQDQIIVLIPDEENRTTNDRKNYILNAAVEIKKELNRQWPEIQIQIGIGKWYQSTLFLNKSYQEAKLALKFGQIWLEDRNIYHVNDLGVLRLLIHVHEEILDDYCREYLGQLIESDKTQGTEYIKTLKAFIGHRGSTSEVSQALFIHPNTLRNRTKKIEEMTGIELQDPQEFMNLIVAIKIQSLLSL